MRQTRLLPIVVSLALVAAAWVFAPAASAVAGATRTWTGAGTTQNWSDAANWAEGAVSAGDALVFPAGPTKKQATNDLPAGTLFASLSFTDGGYTLLGNGLDLSGGITASGTGATTEVLTSVRLTADQTFTVNGPMNLVTTHLALNGAALTLSGNGIWQTGRTSGGTAPCTAVTNPCLTGGGSVKVDGPTALFDAATTAAVLVSGGAVAGRGTTGPVTVNEGNIEPGYTSGGLLKTGDLTLGSSANLHVSFCGTTAGAGCDAAVGDGGGYGQLRVTGAVSLGNASISGSINVAPTTGQAATLIDNDGTDAVVGTFDGLAEGATFPVSGCVNGNPFTGTVRITYVGGDGNDVVVTAESVTPGGTGCTGGPGGGGAQPPTPTEHGSALPAGTSIVHGHVDRGTVGTPAVGASVQVCLHSSGDCAWSTTDAAGNYEITGVPAGTYTVTAFPASNDSGHAQARGDATVADGDSATVDLLLLAPTPPPAGTTFPTARTGADGIPRIYMFEPAPFSTEGCPNATSATFSVAGRTDTGEPITKPGTMTAHAPGSTTYDGTFPALQPIHGPATVTFSFTCPGNDEPTTVSFNAYIDPSGHVVDQNGAAVSGATVTLLRSDTPGGQFLPVPDGSEVMSPSNRHNPDTTDATGHFGWDVLAGYYKVHASHAGCTDAETPVLQIPPPAVDLVIQMTCGSTGTGGGSSQGGGGSSSGGGSTTGAPGSADAPTSLERLAGDDAIGTSIAISKSQFGVVGVTPSVVAAIPAQAVLVARADQYADGLVATPLAVASSAPILLTQRDGLDARTAAEIQRVLPVGGKVILLGGSSALSPSVASALQGIGYKVERVAGTDRYATSVEVAKRLPAPLAILLATGQDFPDAMASGAAAATAKGVVLLTAGTVVPDVVKQFVTSHDVARFAVGGAATKADPAATPLAGVNRYATAVAVADQFSPGPKVVGVATGASFADALSGGAHAAREGGPLLLTERSALPSNVVSYLRAHRATITATYLYGGTAAIDDGVRGAIAAALTP